MILDKLRKVMDEKNIDLYIIPTNDPHGSEYLPDYYKEREFVTGFTGSQGVAVVTKDEALLWADGRYYIQAARQIKETGFSLMKQGLSGVPNYVEWTRDNISNNATIGLNAEYFSENQYKNLYSNVKNKNVKIVDIDLINDLWKDRSPLPSKKAFILDIKYSGKTREEKIDEIREILEKNNSNMTVISSLVDICWILNIRADDIEDTPVLISFLIIDENKVILFADNNKISGIKGELKGIEVRNYDEFYSYLDNYKDNNIYLDIDSINHRIYSALEKENKIIEGINISTNLKAIKNKVEIENLEDTYVRDGVSLFKYICWLKKRVKDNPIGEYEAQLKLDEFRAEDSLYLSNSFGTISAYGPNAAMMHYSASEDSESTIYDKGLYLVDSGGQYYSGTTDITRTLAMGKLTEEEIRDYTITLKCHLNLMDCIFLKGASDIALDGIARYDMWQAHMDYKCGTGHGIGFVLSVHEGPQSIRISKTPTTMKVGMIVSNEPGVYKEGSHGIRIENIMRVVEDRETVDSVFYKFKTISFCPFEIEAIDPSLLSDRQLEVLNKYHEEVYSKLSPYLKGEELELLKRETRKVTR